MWDIEVGPEEDLIWLIRLGEIIYPDLAIVKREQAKVLRFVVCQLSAIVDENLGIVASFYLAGFAAHQSQEF